MADNDQVKEITAKLEQGIQDLFQSETYADYLKTMSRFHRYSTRNTLLIHMQRPDASYVAGFRAWQDKFKRNVKKGEKAIKIFAPAPFIVKKEMEKIDPDTQRPIIGTDGKPVREEIEIRAARFKIANVFAYEQTEGEPLPALAQDLTGDVEQYGAFLDALRSASPLPIFFEDLPPDTDGLCRFGKNIAIREGMSEAQTVSAVIHEITHAKLHDLEILKENEEKPKDRRTQEVEAESVSYAVNQYFGIDTGANSFGYIAEWSRGRDLKELNASLDTIRKTAAELIDAVDERLQELIKERGLEVNTETAPAEAQEKGEGILEYTEFQKQGFAIAKAYESLSLQERLDVIAQTFGYHTAHVETHLCGGKWRGTSDISIRLDNGVSLFIGNRRTPEAKKPSVISGYVNDTLARYNPETVAIAKRQAAIALMKREAADNAAAAERGLKPYTVLTVEMNDGKNSSTGGYLGWYYATLAVDGKIFGMMESGLNHDVARGVVGEGEQGPFFVAGGVKGEEVDFVFNNVGHSSSSNSYKIELTPEVMARAQETLKRRMDFKKAVANVNTTLKTKYHRLYDKFADLFPDFVSGKYSYLRLEANGFEPLSLEYVFGDRISVMQSYTMNGDLMYDPMMEFLFDREGGTMKPCVFEQSMPPLYQFFNEDGIGQSVDGNGNTRAVRDLQSQLDSFASQWIDNIAQQGYIPVKGHILLNEYGNELAIPFDAEGKPIMPESKAELAVDSLPPDPTLTVPVLSEYGYTEPDMYPLSADRAAALFDADHTIYLLYPDNTEAVAFDRDEIITFSGNGFCGISKADWENSPIRAAQIALAESAEGRRESGFLHGEGNQLAIYQLKGGEETRDYRFEGMEQIEKRGLSVDRANYELVYTAPLAENESLNRIYEKFNVSRPEDFKGHSLSVSDVVVLKQGDSLTSHYVDRFGFADLPSFTGEERPSPEPTLSQVETRPQGLYLVEKQPTEAKSKPSLLGRLEENKHKAAHQGENEPHKTSEREV